MGVIQALEILSNLLGAAKTVQEIVQGAHASGRATLTPDEHAAVMDATGGVQSTVQKFLSG